MKWFPGMMIGCGTANVGLGLIFDGYPDGLSLAFAGMLMMVGGILWICERVESEDDEENPRIAELEAEVENTKAERDGLKSSNVAMRSEVERVRTEHRRVVDQSGAQVESARSEGHAAGFAAGFAEGDAHGGRRVLASIRPLADLMASWVPVLKGLDTPARPGDVPAVAEPDEYEACPDPSAIAVVTSSICTPEPDPVPAPSASPPPVPVSAVPEWSGLTPERVGGRVDSLKYLWDELDQEAGQCFKVEVDLWGEVLAAIRDGSPDPAELAGAALLTSAIEFDRDFNI